MSAALPGRPGFAAQTPGPRRGALFAAIAGVGFGAVALALLTQHGFGMQPCPWCVLQRLIFVSIGVVALLALAWRSAAGARVGGGVIVLLALAGLSAALWQHFVAAASASCNLTFADRVVNVTGLNGVLPGVFEARASCADAAVSLLGVPYEFWSAALFVAIAATAIAAMRRA